MNARLARVRRTLVLSTAGRALVFAALTALLVLAVGLVLDTLVGLPLPLRRALLPVALVASGVMLVRALIGPVWAGARASDESIALWLENRLPSLHYALVTSVDAHYVGTVPALERAVTDAPLEREVIAAARAALVRPALAVALIAMGLLLLPAGAVGRVVDPMTGDALARAGTDVRAAVDPLATIVARVTPPGYSGLPAVSYDDPSAIAALAGSRVRVEGHGAGVRAVVRAVVDADTVTARVANGEWSITLPFPPRASAVRLLGPERDRILVLDPIADSIPVARLDQPVRDSVLRTAVGRVTLRAELSDDHGLADAAFEYIVSTGAGETFTFRSGRVGARRFDAGVRSATIGGVLALDTLKLAPGDLIHLRAVARDRNDVTGPGIGASETRTLRIARRDEYDSVSVDPMPPTEPEKSALSQRMILMMTRELHARQRRLSRNELSDESRRIAREQTQLRKRVGEVIFVRLGEDGAEHGDEHGGEVAGEDAQFAGAVRMLESEGDESPVVAINRPLLEAYNHMWRATTELETANPGAAIPWMERAIEALQRARAAERIYLRGRPPRVVVDIAKVRGTGKESGTSNVRVPRAPVDAPRAERLARFDIALGIVATDPAAAADSLLLLRLTVPPRDREVARALDAAAAQMRRGGDVTDGLRRARRALAGVPFGRSGLGPWGI